MSSTMVDWDAFHTKVRAAAPENEVRPSGIFLVGVLRLDIDPNAETLHRRDFVWVKCNARITIAKIKAQYCSKYPEDGQIDLWFRGKIVPSYRTMRDLGTVADPFISLCAMERPVLPTPQLPILAHNYNEMRQLDTGRGREHPSIEDSARPIAFHRPVSPPSSGPAKSSLYADDPTKGAPLPRARTDPGARVPPEVAPVDNGPRVSISEHHVQQPLTKTPERSTSAAPDPDDLRQPQDFNVDAIFNHKPSFKENPEASTRSIDQHIHGVISTQDVRLLEVGVTRSMKILDELKEVFSRYGPASPDTAGWMQSIDNLVHSSQIQRTVIGVVGNTGAGKSSIINALLDEERLVPTNCMRACTAVVTEISWNHDDSPEHKYRAEIEFIDRDEWDREVRALMQEFLTENGRLIPEAHDASSDSGIAWTKFHAVYPRIRGDDFCDRDLMAEKLMKEPAVLNVLGTTKVIERARPETFYYELQKYVDSKEKVTGKKNKERPKQFKSQEIWPLIKVVRLYTKSDALCTGAVVVDLPGVHDSNAARAAVAEKYIKQCTGLWIVAPINRAVDDKAAQNLLGDTFKRQLKYDGNYSAVTFICSKTDDISIEEARLGLDLTDEFTVLEEKTEEYENEIIETKREMNKLREGADNHRTTLNDIDDEIEVWEELKDRMDDGEEVFAPGAKNQKRKKGGRTTVAAKRPRIDESSDTECTDSDDSDSSSEASDSDEMDSPQVPLTTQVVDEKIADLKTAKKIARQEMKSAEELLKELKLVIREKETQLQQLDTQVRALCIQGRSQYSKGAIQHDFAAGIKELDQEAALEADEETFDPDEEIRDYNQVAESLPVFCVSSRAYQKLRGRLKRDDSILGFRTPQDTEIPQLQEHCKKLTEGRRLQASRTFLLSLCQQLTALSLWASTDDLSRGMTKDDKCTEAAFLVEKLEDLEKGLQMAVARCLSSMRVQLREHVIRRMKELVDEAILSAPIIADSWGRQTDQGGLRWNTYRAIVRRGGVYHSPHSGHRDFNAELLEPITKKLASSWERTFQQRLPQAFHDYSENAARVLRAFHRRVEKRARDNGASPATLNMLSGSIRTYEQMFQDLNVQLKTRMTEAQRDANRDFVPTVTNTMTTVYNSCANEYGAGSFGRMKSQMTNFVNHESANMFPAATDTVEQALVQMCRGLEQEMAQKADTIFHLMRTDYMQVLGALDAGRDTLSSPDRSLRSEIVAHLEKMNICFQNLASDGIAAEEDATGEVTDSPQLDGSNEAEQQL